MQIVINISEESYKNIKEQVDKRDYPDMQIGRAIADGVLIPSVTSYETGYNDAKREIALSGEYERAYERGKSDAEQTRWIPVSKRLPEENGDYLVTLENGVVEKLGYSTTQRTTYPKGFYYVEGGFSWRQTINPVIAWMPVPKSFEPQESEDKE